METIVANFCDEQMLFMPQYYTDEGNHVLLERLAEEFTKQFKDTGDEQFDEAERQFMEDSLKELIEGYVLKWWDKYPNAFKYRNHLWTSI